MALPIRPFVNMAMQAGRAVAPHLPALAQAGATAYSAHAAAGAGAPAGNAPPPAPPTRMPPQPSARNAMAQRLLRQYREGQGGADAPERSDDAAFERAQATVRAAQDLG